MHGNPANRIDPRYPLPPTLALLRSMAVIDLDPRQHNAITELVSQAGLGGNDPLPAWKDLVERAEKHGLSALLATHMKTLGIPVPADIHQQLLALKIRHRRANGARAVAAESIINHFEERGIRSVLLKGMALVNLVYPQPELRPMSDIDILVDPRRADDAQQCLKDLGYQARSRQSGYQFDHHHLPIASHRVDKVSVYVEVHHDALSGDVAQSITLDALTGPLIGFDLGTARGHGLGHMDTLRHLCHHTFEPVEEIKLGAVADLYGYASKYIDDIDTARLDNEYPFVANIFRLLHYLTPLPEPLRDWISSPGAPAPAGVGYGYPPMTHGLAGNGNLIQRAAGLFTAPPWWLHSFYNVKPENSITPTRLVRHPQQVVKWLGRRARAKWRDKRAAATR